MLKSFTILKDLANRWIRLAGSLFIAFGIVDTLFPRLPLDWQERLAFLRGLPSLPVATWAAIFFAMTFVLLTIAVTKKFGWTYEIEIELEEENFTTSKYGLNYVGLRIHNASSDRIYDVKPIVSEIIIVESGKVMRHLNDELRWSSISVAFATSKDADYQDQTILPDQSLVADVAFASSKPDEMRIRSRRGDLYMFSPGDYLIEIKVYGKYKGRDFLKPHPFYGLLSFPNGLEFHLNPLTQKEYDDMSLGVASYE